MDRREGTVFMDKILSPLIWCDPKTWRHCQAARTDPLTQKSDVTDRLPGMTLWPKNVTSLTGCQDWPSDPRTWRHWQAARTDLLTQKRDVTDRLPGMTLWPKNVTSLTRGPKWPFRCLEIIVINFWIHLQFWPKFGMANCLKAFCPQTRIKLNVCTSSDGKWKYNAY